MHRSRLEDRFRPISRRETPRSCFIMIIAIITIGSKAIAPRSFLVLAPMLRSTEPLQQILTTTTVATFAMKNRTRHQAWPS